MANYESLKAAIQDVVKTNGNNEITGALLQQSLLAMINSLGTGYQFMGVAVLTPTATNPGTPDQNVFYIASESGTYSNFGGLSVSDGEVAILKYNGTWTKEVTGAATAAQVTQLGQDVADNTDNINALQEEIDAIQPIVIEGNVTNAPDEEDITTDENDLLKFKDRTQAVNQMGYVILRKDKTFAEQVTLANTIYEIRYSFDLGGGTVNIPAGCVLKFDGGLLSNGTLNGNGTKVEGNARFSCDYGGSFDVDKTKVSWFGTTNSGFENAMDFCAVSTGKTLDGEGLQCSLSGTVTFKAKHNINLERLNILYTPTANGESMFLFDCETQYGAGNKYIRDCSFECVATSFTNIHCLNFQRWYNTTRATFERIFAKKFNGYVIVNQSYLQEAVFNTVKGGNCGGFISYNTDKNYGATSGSSNLVLFINCGIDDGIDGNVPYVVDMCDMMTVHFMNFVAQGSNANATSTRALRIDQTNTLFSDVVLDAFWVEFYGNTDNFDIVDIGSHVNLTLMHRTPLRLNCNGNGIHVKINTDTVYEFEYLLDNLNIVNDASTFIEFDFGGNNTEISVANMEKVLALYKRGVCCSFKYRGQVNRAPLVVFDNNLSLHEDGIARYIEHSITRQNAGTLGMKVLSINGVNALSFSANNTQQSVILPYPSFLPNQRIVYVDIIFRIFTEIAVTSSNISTIICSSAMFSPNNFKQGSAVSPYTPQEGQAAGYTDGWKRVSYVVHATDAVAALKTFYLTMRNTRIEFAKISYKNMFSIDDEEVFIDNGDLVRRNSGADHYRLLGIDSYQRTVVFNEEIYNIFKESDACFDVEGKSFKACKGNVDLISSSFKHSGTSSQRPVFSTVVWVKTYFAGWIFFDTTLNKAIIWNGSAWVNMDGTALS